MPAIPARVQIDGFSLVHCPLRQGPSSQGKLVTLKLKRAGVKTHCFIVAEPPGAWPASSIAEMDRCDNPRLMGMAGLAALSLGKLLVNKAKDN